MPKDSYGSSRVHSAISGTLGYVYVSAIALFSVFPFVWMIICATNYSKDISMGKMTPGLAIIDNFKSLGSLLDLGMLFGNSLIVTATGTFCTLLAASMAGYGFEMYRSKARERVYSLMLLTMMVLFAAMMIPLFRMFAKAGALNSFAAVIPLSVASIFVIFFFGRARASARSHPGCPRRRTRRVQGVLPHLHSVDEVTFAAAAIIVFMSYWNNFLY